MNTAERAAYAMHMIALVPGAELPTCKVTSKYLGVSHTPCEATPWSAKVYIDGELIYLGSSKSEIGAAKLVHQYGVLNNVNRFKILGA